MRIIKGAPPTEKMSSARIKEIDEMLKDMEVGHVLEVTHRCKSSDTLRTDCFMYIAAYSAGTTRSMLVLETLAVKKVAFTSVLSDLKLRGIVKCGMYKDASISLEKYEKI